MKDLYVIEITYGAWSRKVALTEGQHYEKWPDTNWVHKGPMDKETLFTWAVSNSRCRKVSLNQEELDSLKVLILLR